MINKCVVALLQMPPSWDTVTMMAQVRMSDYRDTALFPVPLPASYADNAS